MRGCRRTTGSRPRRREARRALAELRRQRRHLHRHAASASSPRPPASRRWPSSTSRIRTRRWSPARPMSGCGSPSSCAICRRSSGSAACKGLDEIEDRRDAVSFGAMVTHTEAMPYLAAIDPDLGELMRRFAGKQVRSAGTVGGNIANGSPIGDTAAGADRARRDARRCSSGERPRTLPLEDFFLDYGKQDRAAGRVRARGARPEVRRGRALPLLQDLQALRPGHFRRDGRVQAARRRHAHRGRAHRLRRHGGNPEARARRREGADREPISTGRRDWDEAIDALGAGLHADRRSARERRNIASTSRARCCARR